MTRDSLMEDGVAGKGTNVWRRSGCNGHRLRPIIPVENWLKERQKASDGIWRCGGPIAKSEEIERVEFEPISYQVISSWSGSVSNTIGLPEAFVDKHFIRGRSLRRRSPKIIRLSTYRI